MPVSLQTAGDLGKKLFADTASGEARCHVEIVEIGTERRILVGKNASESGQVAAVFGQEDKVRAFVRSS